MSAGVIMIPIYNEFDAVQYYGEGWGLAIIVVVGLCANVFAILVIRDSELNLIQNFSRLLQFQAACDMGYLVTNVPAFVFSGLGFSFAVDEVAYFKYSRIMIPILHIFLTGSNFTTVALAVERLGAMKIPNSQSRRGTHFGQYPLVGVISTIICISVTYNIPRFLDTEIAYHQETTLKRINNTGIDIYDHSVLTVDVPHLDHSQLFPLSYFIYYKQVGAFILTSLCPFLGLTVLNFLISRKLEVFRRVSIRLGREQRKTVRATASLMAIVFLFLACHSVKLVVNGYQVIQVLSEGEQVHTWPTWLEYCTIISHLLLAINSSINLLLYCACDRHFWVIAQKRVKLLFVWPITLRREFASFECVFTRNLEIQENYIGSKETMQTMVTEL